MKEQGVLIEKVDPQPEVRKNAEKARDWVYTVEAKYLYEKAITIRDRLIDPIARIDRSRLPDPVIGFKDMRNYKVLAAYLIGRDDVGLNSRINLNTEHYLYDPDTKELKWEFGRWSQLETLTHEYLHLWQQLVGEMPVKGRRSPHNKEFVERARQIGLYVFPDIGFHYQIADGPFLILMKELGIEPPADVPTKSGGKLDWFKFSPEKREGRSSLTKWTCPECGLNVRMGIKGNPELRHHPCEQKTGQTVFLIRSDQTVINQVVYKAPDTAEPEES